MSKYQGVYLPGGPAQIGRIPQRGSGGSVISGYDIVGIGDSQTSRLGAQNYIEISADLVQTRQGGTISRAHHGLSGSSWNYSFDNPSLIDDLPNAVALCKATSKVAFFAGTNGLWLGGHTALQELADANSYLTAFFAAAPTVNPANCVLITCPPRETMDETLRANYNAGLAILAASFGMKEVKLHLNTDIGIAGQQNDIIYFSDAIHLTAAGDDELGRLLYDMLYTDFITAFTPSQLPNYYDHWDAQIGGSITQAGSRVSAWAAASGSGQVLAQATSGNQPLYNATGLNGHPTLEFDGASRRAFLDKSSGIILNAKSMSHWCVAQFSETSGDHMTWYLGVDDTFWENGLYLYSNGAAVRVADAVNGGTISQVGGADTSSHLWTGITNGAAGSLYKDGAGPGSGNFNNATAVNAIALRLGSPILDFWRMQGYIGEFGFCTAPINAYWRQLLEYKLAAKWGTPAPNGPYS